MIRFFCQSHTFNLVIKSINSDIQGFKLQKGKPILLVEDVSIDSLTVKHAFKDLKVTHLMIHCSDGKEGFEYLSN